MEILRLILMFCAGLTIGPFVRQVAIKVSNSRDKIVSVNPLTRFAIVDVFIAFSSLAFAYKYEQNYFAFPAILLFSAFAALVLIDIETHLLPNRIIWPLFWSSLLVVAGVGLVFSSNKHSVSALVGAVIFSGFLGLAFLVYPKGMGLGDVKLALILGLFIGWLSDDYLQTARVVLNSIVISLLAAGIIGMVYNYLKKLGNREVPFGPFLIYGTLLVVLLSGAN